MTESKVLKAITVTEELSLTAIAKKLGMNKANQELKNNISSLMQAGKITKNSAGRFDTYQKVGKSKVAKQSGNESSSVVQSPKKDLPDLPEASENKVSGYSIKKLEERGKEKIKISLPSGKSIKINPDDSLLVINDEPKYVVKTAKDVVTCIKEYSTAKGMRTFTVDDITQNKKIGTEDDIMIKDQHIMFLSIKKHNKAA